MSLIIFAAAGVVDAMIAFLMDRRIFGPAFWGCMLGTTTTWIAISMAKFLAN